MGAPLGNQNAAKAKQWAAAIERAVARLGGAPLPDPDDRSPYMRGIDELADSFVAQKKAENPIAFYKEFGDRTDGKAHQSIDAAITGGMTVTLDHADGDA